MSQGIIKPLIPEGAKSPASLRQFVDALRRANPIAANAFERTQQSLDRLEQILREQPQQSEEMVFTDADGKVIFWLGSREGYFGGWLGQAYVGANGPADAPFFVDANGVVNVGKNGAIQVIDPAGNSVGEIGVTTESSQAITAATNATPVVVTIVAHGYEDGDTVVCFDAAGNTAVNGYRLVKNATTDTFELTDFAGSNVVGNGAYTGGGFCFRYFGGSRFETFAIGASFPSYKLRAFADGKLKIKDAFITLSGSISIITLDPSTGNLTITPNPATGRTLTLNSQKIELLDKDGLGVFRIIDNEDPPSGLPPAPSEGNVIWLDTGATSTVYALDLRASSCGGIGATLRIAGMNGTKLAPTATAVGNRLGTIMLDGYASGQVYIRGTQKSATDTELTISTTTSGFSYTRLRCDELGVEVPSNNLRVPSGYINVGGAAVAGKKLTVVGVSYLNGNVELPLLTASLPLKVNSSKVVTAAKIDVNDTTDVTATGFSAGDYAQWDGTKFVPVTLAALAASLVTPLTPSFAVTGVLSGGAHTLTLAKITPGGTDGAIQFNADGQLIAYVDPT